MRLTPNVALVPLAFLVLAGCGGGIAPMARSVEMQIAENGTLVSVLPAHNVFERRITFAAVTGPSHGELDVDAATGAFTYRPAPYFNGTDQFAYTASAGSRTSAVATITVVVTPVNYAPEARDQTVQLAEDVPLGGQLAATDVDGDALRFMILQPPRHGRIYLDGFTGAYTYKPNPDYSGPDLFRFVASDGQLDSAPAAVAITVAPMNDAPKAAAQTASVPADGILIGTLWAEDVEDDPISYSISAFPRNGTLDFVPGKSAFTYRPVAGFVGTDSFRFTAHDGILSSEPATVSIEVQETAPSAPQIHLQRGKTTVSVGESAVMGITVSAMPPVSFSWLRNGVELPGTSSPVFSTPPATRDDDGVSYAVKVWGQGVGVPSLSWMVSVAEARADQQVFKLFSNERETFPDRQPLAVKSIGRAATGIGARVTFAAGTSGLPLTIDSAGAGTITFDAGAGDLSVTFPDTETPEVLSTRITLWQEGSTSGKRLALKYENAAWLSEHGQSRPPRVVITELGVPPASSQVEDWIKGTPTADDVAFAEATWGSAVAPFTSSTDKAQALARVLIDQLEPHRGVPSDLIDRSHPFEQWRLATSGLGEVWCSNIAAIFTLASKSFGIPARIVSVGKTLSAGSEYILQTAEGHSTVEIFDQSANGWVWIDPTLYVLGMRREGGGMLNVAEVLEGLNDPARMPTMFALDYDPGGQIQTARPVLQSANLAGFQRFFRREAALAFPKNGITLAREYYSNEPLIYPRIEDIAIRSVEPLPGDYGVLLRLASAMSELDRFEYRQVAAYMTSYDPAVRSSPDGWVALRFGSPHATVGQSMQYAVRAVDRSGTASPEHLITLFFYSKELYAANGLTTRGVLIFDAGDLRTAAGLPYDWITDIPSLEDVHFAEAEWGSTLDPEAPPLHRARVLATRLIESMTPAMGVPSGVVSSPFEQYARVLSEQDFADSTTMARVFSHACNSLGIPARIVEMGRILSLGPDYDLFGAEDHAAVEVFDPVGNRWVWMDLAFGMLGVELQGYGALNASEMKRALNDAFQAENLLAIVYDAVSHLEARVPLAASPGAAGITALLQSNIDLRYSRRAP